MFSNAVVDPRGRRYLTPTRVVWQSDSPAPQRAAQLLTPWIAPTITTTVPSCILDNIGGMCSVLLDFGREIHGAVTIGSGETTGNQPVRIRVRFGESIGEAMGQPNDDHAIHDQTIKVPWLGNVEVGTTGFRFVRIDLLGEGARLELRQVRAILLVRELTYHGAFESSDDRLNKIWQTGAYTVHLCMQDVLWDGIKRDRLAWMGDIHPMTRVISAVFGADPIVQQSLDLMKMVTPLPGWMQGISSYSLWWIITQHDWHRTHGNVEYLDDQRWYLLELLTLLCQQIDETGSEKLDGWRFLDWPTNGNLPAVHAGLQALLTWALRDGGKLCGVLGEIKQREKCAGVREQCRHAVEMLERHPVDFSITKQSAALASLARLGDADAINDATLSRDPFGGLSTFYGYYVLEARARARDIEGCLTLIRGYWGAMLDRGATTFWEDFSLDWLIDSGRIDELTPPGQKDLHADFGAHCYTGVRHSLCHGWAAGPTAWLSENILGITPVTPGCATIRVKPKLGDLEWADGTYPTPFGPVKVHHERRPGGVVKSEVETPEGVKVVP